MPLLAETEAIMALFYALGFGFGWWLFGRRRARSYLGDER